MFTWTRNIFDFVLRFLMSKYQNSGLHYITLFLISERSIGYLTRGHDLLAEPRYTAIIDLRNFESVENYEKHLRKDRRQDKASNC